MSAVIQTWTLVSGSDMFSGPWRSTYQDFILNHRPAAATPAPAAVPTLSAHVRVCAQTPGGGSPGRATEHPPGAPTVLTRTVRFSASSTRRCQRVLAGTCSCLSHRGVSGCELASRCGSVCFPNDSWSGASFHVLLGRRCFLWRPVHSDRLPTL